MIIPPAQRLQTVEEYYFSRKLQEIRRMIAGGEPVINLGIGDPDLPPSEATIASLSESAHGACNHGYQSYRGIPEFRSAIAGYMSDRYGVPFNPATEILPLPGSKQGMIYVALAFLNPGDAVLVPDPGYPTYTSVSRLAGASVVPYVLDEQHAWQPDWEKLERQEFSGVKMMWVNYPHMPTGTPATRELFTRLVAFAGKHGILLCHDNPYSQLVDRGSPLSIFVVPGARDVAIELNSLSKSHNMAGWRIGWVAGRNDYVDTILKIASNVESGMFLPAQRAAIAALGSGPDWYARLRETYAGRRAVGMQIMHLLGCVALPHQAGMFVWARIPGGERHAEAFADRILEATKIFVVPGSVFGPSGSRYIRLSLCSPAGTLQAAADRLTAFGDSDPTREETV
jgi:aspartate/methionine/tyrosine aminotransferase